MPERSRHHLIAPVLLGLWLLLTRFMFSASLEWDEAEQVLFTQQLAWGYSHQPPLYTWLVWLAVSIFGVNLFAVTLVKAIIFAGLICCLSRCLSRLGVTPALATAGGFALFFSPTFAWAVLAYTHTLLACLFFAATLLQVLRLSEQPRAGNFLLLGLLVGCGTIAKYNYVIFTGCLLAAALWTPALRRALLRPGLVVSVAAAFMLVAPHLAWAWQWRDMIASRLQQSAGLDFTAPPPTAGSSLGILLQSIVIGFGPLFLLAFLLLRRAEPASAADHGGANLPGLRLIERTLILGLTALLTLALAGVDVRLHWLAPLILLAPLSILGRAAQRRLQVDWRPWAMMAAAVLLCVTTVRWFASVWVEGKRDRDAYFAMASAALAEHDLVGSDLLVVDVLTAGNLRYRNPELRIACVECPAAAVPEPARPRFIVWNSSAGDAEAAYVVIAASLMRSKVSAAEVRARTIQVATLDATPSERFTKLAFCLDAPAAGSHGASASLPRSLTDIAQAVRRYHRRWAPE